MKIKTGDMFYLDGAYQVFHTRDYLPVKIDPYDMVKKVRDNFSDRLKLRYMFEVIGTEYEVDIPKELIERYFRSIEDEQ